VFKHKETCFKGFRLLTFLPANFTPVFWLFILAFIAQAGYALYFFIRMPLAPATVYPSPAEHRPVSIIICARNEAANLKKNLPKILSQKYNNEAGQPLYEVIVVNDASTDDTTRVLQELELKYDNLWDVVVPADEKRNNEGKKFALSKGIAHAVNEWLLLTDADCAPASDKWLELMARPLAAGKEIVAGYGGYNTAYGVLNSFIRWETVHTFLQYSNYAIAGRPYMAVGRNLACTKKIWLAAQAHPIWSTLPSGDDDLLVRIAANNANYAVMCDRRAFTRSAAKSTWKEWAMQKRRHLSTGKYYKKDIKLLLGGYAAAHALLWLSFFLLLATPHRPLAVVMMSVRCIIYWVIWGLAAHRLNEKKLIYLFPAFDIAWMIYNFAFFPFIAWKNNRQWK
jgi:glycosyltransferase involved in cell wall biosynthesis